MTDGAMAVAQRSGALLVVEDDGENDHIDHYLDRLQASERYIECDRPVEVRQ